MRILCLMFLLNPGYSVYNPGGDMLFTVEVNDVGVVSMAVSIMSVKFSMLISEGGVHVVGEGNQVCYIVVGEGVFRWDVQWSV